MSGWDRRHGCNMPGRNGRATHLGDPLTVQQIRDLPDGAEIVVTWSGGNGPWPYRVLVDVTGVRRVETIYADPILPDWPDQTNPLHRVTAGWDDAGRTWHDGQVPAPAHIREMWRRLRGR